MVNMVRMAIQETINSLSLPLSARQQVFSVFAQIFVWAAENEIEITFEVLKVHGFAPAFELTMMKNGRKSKVLIKNYDEFKRPMLLEKIEAAAFALCLTRLELK